jgi:elongator complex protein 4
MAQVLRPCDGPNSLESAAQGAVEFAGSFLPPAPPPGVPASVVPVRGGPETVGRLVVQSICSPLWSTTSDDSSSSSGRGSSSGGEPSDEEAWRAVALLLYRLRMAVQDTRCAAVVTCEAGRWVGGCSIC